MANKKSSNIQRKNMKPQMTSLYHSSGNKSQESTNEPVEHVNSFTFTTIGMFAGLIVGYILKEINWGFGIGLLIGALIDFIMNYLKKKTFEKKYGIPNKTSTD